MEGRTVAVGVLLVFLGASASRLHAQSVVALPGHGGAVFAITFRPDGEQMASASLDHTVKLWDVAAGRATRTLAGHRDKVLALAYSADGKRLASASVDGTIRVWDAESGQETIRLESSGACSHSLAFTPDGRLVGAGEDGSVEVWSRTGRRLGRFTPHPDCGPLYALAISPDGRSLTVGGLDGHIWVLDARKGKVLRELEGHPQPVYSLAFGPDGGTLLSGSGDGTVRCWNPTTGEQTACLAGHRGAVYQAAFSLDGRRVVSAGTDGEVIVWDEATGTALHRHRFPGKALCAAFTPDGRRIGAGTVASGCFLLELPRHVR
jgi:WD40 repeat protein